MGKKGDAAAGHRMSAQDAATRKRLRSDMLASGIMSETIAGESNRPVLQLHEESVKNRFQKTASIVKKSVSKKHRFLLILPGQIDVVSLVNNCKTFEEEEAKSILNAVDNVVPSDPEGDEDGTVSQQTPSQSGAKKSRTTYLNNQIGTLECIDSPNPVLRFDFPAPAGGYALRLYGTILYPEHPFLTIKNGAKKSQLVLEDQFQSVIVFSRAKWFARAADGSIGKGISTPVDLVPDAPADDAGGVFYGPMVGSLNGMIGEQSQVDAEDEDVTEGVGEDSASEYSD